MVFPAVAPSVAVGWSKHDSKYWPAEKVKSKSSIDFLTFILISNYVIDIMSKYF